MPLLEGILTGYNATIFAYGVSLHHYCSTGGQGLAGFVVSWGTVKLTIRLLAAARHIPSAVPKMILGSLSVRLPSFFD